LTAAALFALLFAAPALAQREPPVAFEDVRIGLPPGRFVDQRDSNQRGASIIKRNTWAPIYVRLKLNREVRGGAKLRVETTDADGLKTRLVVPLIKNLSDRLPGSMVEPSELGYVPYVRCGDQNGQISLTVLSDPADGGDPKAISDTYRTNYNNLLQFRDMSTYVVVSLGSRLPGFDLKDEQGNPTANQSGRASLRNGRVETSAITNVREMPDHWFGYQAADLVVLTTGTAPNDFLDELFDPQISEQFRPRRDALLEWVRRGGKLVVSVGSNASKLAAFKLFQDMVPAPLKLDPPTAAVPELKLVWRGPANAPERETLRTKNEGGTFPVARLAPNPARPPRVLIETTTDPALTDKPDLPIVVQSAYGLGRITLVAFDLDQSPFIDSPKKADFWDWLIRESGSARSAQATKHSNNYYGGSDAENEFMTALRTHVDTFDGVPVISFGWVALFIILYTLLIGPVEYLFLKRVLGRLELTWITFPLIVVTVSAAAYFTAYAIKGKDLKLNKVDVVDVDLAGGRVYGRTWFTIFSPRIDSYTIAVEPRDGWGVAPPAPVPPNQAALVGWMGGGRGGGAGIISRGYAYNTDESGRVLADGLDRVPIQVWSTKAFTASWTAPADPGTPLVAADLYHPPADPNAVAGSFVSNLPVSALQEPVLFYRGTAYKLPPLTPGREVDVIAAGRAAAGGLPPDNDWLARNATLPAANQPGYNPGFGRSGSAVPTTSNLSLWGALFHEKALGRGVGALQNASLRELDQSWRLSDEYRDEAILVARVSESGLAESVMADPTGPSVTKLWLKGLPGNPNGRQPVPGTLRQETYIRVYIPVKPKPGRAGK
jgi:hypothetical protein